MILIPVLLGSCFLVALDYLWFSSNSLVLKNQRRNEVSIALSESFTAVTSYCFAVINSGFGTQPAVEGQGSLVLQQVPLKLALLNAQVNLDPEQFAREIEIKNGLLDILAEADRVASSIQKSHTTNNLQRVAIYDKLMRRALTVTDQMQAANKHRLFEQAHLRQQQDLLQATLKALVFLAFACGSIISAIVFLDFAKNTLTRVKILAHNASGLARLEAPADSNSGADKLSYDDLAYEGPAYDELAYLDSIFREVATALKTAREEQQSIVQMITHDMRSPIMATEVSITTFEEFFVDALPAKAIEWCQEITNACNHVLTFVNELLTIEALESGTIVLAQSDFSVRELVQDCLGLLSDQASTKALCLENECLDRTIKADRNRVSQVLTIFLSNAIKAAPEHSVISVSSQSKAGFETVTVQDSGPTLSKLQRRQAFDRFSPISNDGKKGPFGLGLFICKMIVECHGGRVGAESDSGKGRRFWFSLPDEAIGAPQLHNATKVEDYLQRQERPTVSLVKYIEQSLIGKILILVMIPVIAQAAWLIWIDGQLAKSQRLVKQEQQQADIVTMISEMWVRGYRANANSVFFTVFHDPDFKKRAAEDIRALRLMTDDLDLNIHRDVGEKALWQDTKALVGREASQIDQHIEKSATGDINAELAHAADRIVSIVQLSNRIEKLIDQELGALSAIGRANEEFRKQFQSFILWAIAFNILLSVLQWWAFRHDISRRMNILVNNARKLPTRGALQAQIAGCDEIATLDLLLHQAASELHHSDTQRKEVMELIAQNIGAPLISVAHYLSLLDQEVALATGLDIKGKQNIEAARRNIDRVQMLSNDLFAIDQFSGLKDELKLSQCHIGEVIEESMTSVTSLAGAKNIKIETSIADITLLIDKGRMIQVLVNLLANSIKFSPEHSLIVIKTQATVQGLQITVKDCGPGMDKATREKIFEKFVLAKNQKQKAFGLGLAICKLIVEAHDGQIGVESSPGKGSTFWLEIPGCKTTTY